jgi:hypothetical protein
VRRDLRLLARGVVAVVAVMLAAGTVVTGTGPLAGAGAVPRYHLPLAGVTQFHSDIGLAAGRARRAAGGGAVPDQGTGAGWCGWAGSCSP